MQRVFLVLFVSFCLAGCSPNSSEEFYQEGEALTKELVQTLRGISKREELVAAIPHLKRQFDRLADLMIEARIYQENSQEPAEVDVLDRTASNALMQEFARVYSSIEEGRELIERAQQEALFKLDAFESSIRR